MSDIKNEVNNETTFKCDKCNGSGKIQQPPKSNIKSNIKSKIFMKINCPKCNGDGYLDWVENIVGKNKKPFRYIKPTVTIKEIDLSDRVPTYINL